MRYVTALVVCLVAVGLVATTLVADDSIFGMSYYSQQKVVSLVKIVGVGKTKLTMECPRAYGYVGSPGEAGYPGSSYFSGIFTVTNPGGDGGGQYLTSTVSMGFPFTGFSRGENKVSLKSTTEEWSHYIYDVENFLNRSHGVFTDTEPYEYKKAPAELGGPISITSIKSGGKIKTDKKTFSKFGGSLAVKYTGTILSGPNAGRAVKGKLRVKMKKGEPVDF